MKYTHSTVRLGARTYDVHFGPNALRAIRTDARLRMPYPRRAVILADRRLPAAREKLYAALGSAMAGRKPLLSELIEIPVEAGEGLKEMDRLLPIYGELLRAKADRDTLLFALGGGSVGDAAGFLAATYLRGIDWVGVPTTLLAQVDSAIGGKTGVNHAYGKNLIGAFHQPRLVVADPEFLRTLGPSEIISGLGEVVKTALLFDISLYRDIERTLPRLLARDERLLATITARAAAWKCKIVPKDEFDRKGVREVLNLGHTYGHALESRTKYKVFQHGEAVLHGMRFAVALSEVRGRLAPRASAEIDATLARFPVPPIPADFSTRDALARMARDKKVRNGKIHFVLLTRIGRAVSDGEVTERDLFAAQALFDARREITRKAAR